MTITANQQEFSNLEKTKAGKSQAIAGAQQSSMPGILLRVEGLAVAIAALTLYAVNDYRWWVLALLVLAPDLSAIGYLVGKRVGAICYNMVHTYALPLMLGLAGFLLGWPVALQLALIWFVHIGIDRLAGYGLKYNNSFKYTHIQAANNPNIQ